MELIFRHLDIFFFVKQFSHPLQANFCSMYVKKVQDITLHYVDCNKKSPKTRAFWGFCKFLIVIYLSGHELGIVQIYIFLKMESASDYDLIHIIRGNGYGFESYIRNYV